MASRRAPACSTTWATCSRRRATSAGPSCASRPASPSRGTPPSSVYLTSATAIRWTKQPRIAKTASRSPSARRSDGTPNLNENLMCIAFAAILPAALFAAAFAAPAGAQLAAPQTRIGAISLPQLLRDSPQVRAANDKFKAEFQKREDDLKAEGKKLSEDAKKYQREGDTM